MMWTKWCEAIPRSQVYHCEHPYMQSGRSGHLLDGTKQSWFWSLGPYPDAVRWGVGAGVWEFGWLLGPAKLEQHLCLSPADNPPDKWMGKGDGHAERLFMVVQLKGALRSAPS